MDRPRERPAHGWLHLTHLLPQPPDSATPFPDFLQIACQAKASEREDEPHTAWVDTEGYELRSRLVAVEEALKETTCSPRSPSSSVNSSWKALTRA
ncbi:hypothetical protein GCM10018953_47310 [Streptosporangium nondiastaticum]